MLNTAFFIVGASSRLAGATAHGHVRRYPALLHDTIAIIRLQPHHSYHPARRGIHIGSTIQLARSGASVQIPIAHPPPLRPQYATAVSSLGACPTSALIPHRVWHSQRRRADIGQPLTKTGGMRIGLVAGKLPFTGCSRRTPRTTRKTARSMRDSNVLDWRLLKAASSRRRY